MISECSESSTLVSVHAQLRKIIKTRGHFPSDEAATKLIWLALRNITAKWARGAIRLERAMMWPRTVRGLLSDEEID